MTLEYHDTLGTRDFAFGIAASNLGNAVNPDTRLPEQAPQLLSTLGAVHLGVEWQMEGNVREMLAGVKGEKPAFIGVHLPTSDVDIQMGEEAVIHALSQNLAALEQAQALGAEYAVLHIQTHDHWERLGQRQQDSERGLAVLDQLLAAYRQHGLSVPLLIENVEFPKFPATRQELVRTVRFIEERADVPLGIAIDFGHLWHSGRIIGENLHQPGVGEFADAFARNAVPFRDYLRESLLVVQKQLQLIHVTGCVEHRTHDRPLVKPSYGQTEMDVAEALRVLYDVSSGMLKAPRIVNETIGVPYQQMQADSLQLQEYIHARKS